MTQEVGQSEEIQKLDILSPKRLGHILGFAPARLAEIARYADTYYQPFETFGKIRWFPKEPSKSRTIDNPRGALKKIQRRIYRKLLRPICFPEHVLGGVCKRGVWDNAGLHLGTTTLVSVDIRKCFPSITNLQIYKVWQQTLGCSRPVARLLTRLTTYKRRLPQGSPASPLLANLLIWSIDEPIRMACQDKGVVYSTWIDDLAFSGLRAREIIQVAAITLANNGLRLSHKKIKIMGPTAPKLLTGTRLGKAEARASRERLARLRSGINKLRSGLVSSSQHGGYVEALIGQLIYVESLCPRDAVRYKRDLAQIAVQLELPVAKERYLSVAF
jgi:RNA-directed DNA polymerase